MLDQSTDDEESLLFNLAYCSRATRALSPSEIDTIVTKARAHNASKKITGWLVYGSGIFFQWLEGAREDVQLLMTSIRSDARHNTVVVLNESEDVRERLFGEWDMELVSARDIREVLVDAIAESDSPKNVQALRKLMQEMDSGNNRPGLMNNLVDL